MPHPKNADEESRSPAAESHIRYRVAPSSPDAAAAPRLKSNRISLPSRCSLLQSNAASAIAPPDSPCLAHTNARRAHKDPSRRSQNVEQPPAPRSQPATSSRSQEIPPPHLQPALRC